MKEVAARGDINTLLDYNDTHTFYIQIYRYLHIHTYIHIHMISLERKTASRKSAFLDNRVQSLDIFYVKILPFKKFFGRFG